jgi:hypothetical protein
LNSISGKRNFCAVLPLTQKSNPMKPYLFFVLLLALTATACQSDQQNKTLVAPPPSPDHLGADYFLPILGLDKRYKDLGVLEMIKVAQRPVRPGTVINGEAQFPVYQVFDDNNQVLANIFYNQNGELEIPFFVEIVSSSITTPEGIKVGDTYARLIDTYGDLPTTGSEIEGWTHAYLGLVQFRMDAYNPQVQNPTINPEDEILAIGFFF